MDDDIYKTFLYFVAERQNIFWRRLHNEDIPWTDDWILHTYKFTNVYRVLDRASQYLIKHVQSTEHYNWSFHDQIFRTLLFKLFNSPNTWEWIMNWLGEEPNLENFDFYRYCQCLDEAMAKDIPIYSPAYMMTGQKFFSYNTKHHNHIALLEYLFFKESIHTKLENMKSLEELYKFLFKLPYHGPFLAMQYAIDLNYLDYWQFDENSFVKPGPGSIRGVKKVMDDADTNRAIKNTTDHLQANMFTMGISWHPLPGRGPTLIDIQNTFCEIDKYLRVAKPEIKSNKTRIKTKFHPKSDKIEYIFPPWWEMEELN